MIHSGDALTLISYGQHHPGAFAFDQRSQNQTAMQAFSRSIVQSGQYLVSQLERPQTFLLLSDNCVNKPAELELPYLRFANVLYLL